MRRRTLVYPGRNKRGKESLGHVVSQLLIHTRFPRNAPTNAIPAKLPEISKLSEASPSAFGFTFAMPPPAASNNVDPDDVNALNIPILNLRLGDTALSGSAAIFKYV